MRPYYDEAGITIYHADCREVLADLPRPDLLILDPPFNEWQEVPPINATTILAFTRWDSRAHVEALHGRPRTEVIWHFLDGRWVSHQLPIVTHETILVYGALNDVYVGEEHDQTPRKTGTGTVLRRTVTTRTTYQPRPRRALNSVLQFAQNPASEELGRWAKPLGLMRVLMEWAATGPVVLDPYMGGGTTLRIAKDMGLHAFGIERDERYCELAVRRLAQEALIL